MSRNEQNWYYGGPVTFIGNNYNYIGNRNLYRKCWGIDNQMLKFSKHFYHWGSLCCLIAVTYVKFNLSLSFLVQSVQCQMRWGIILASLLFAHFVCWQPDLFFVRSETVFVIHLVETGWRHDNGCCRPNLRREKVKLGCNSIFLRDEDTAGLNGWRENVLSYLWGSILLFKFKLKG